MAWRRIGARMRKVLDVLSKADKTWGLRQTDIILKAEGLTEVDGVAPKRNMAIASALKGKRVGKCISPLNQMERLYASIHTHEDPALKEKYPYKMHFEWLDEFHEGKKRSDKLYASYSRAINQLLKLGLIESEYTNSKSGEYRRHHRTRYFLPRPHLSDEEIDKITQDIIQRTTTP